jgi:threonine aldolase
MFASDNWAGAADSVMSALAEANEDAAPAYGADRWTGRASDLLSGFFERDVFAVFVSTGSAANALALASYSRPGGVVLAHTDAHILRDEAAAPALFSAGNVIDAVDGPAGKIDAAALAERIASYAPGVVHFGRPVAVSLTNVNEIGQSYTPAEVAEIAAVAKGRGLAVHMDGARFANAVVHTAATPADLTWRAGVDVLSLGFTKAGAWCAEAVVFFDAALKEDVLYRHKQAAQLFSKNRFVAAQFCALLDRHHVLGLAAHANGMASALAEVLAASGEAILLHAPASNEIFAWVSPAGAVRLEAAGIVAHPWTSHSAHLPAAPAADWQLRRFVTSFRTTTAEVAALASALAARDAA